MTNRLVSLVEFFPTLETLRYSDQHHEEINDYYDALLAPVEIIREQPDLFTGIIPDRTARVRVSNISGAKETSGFGAGSTATGAEVGAGEALAGGQASHPIIAHIQAAEDLRGKAARARVRDLDASTDLFDLTGTIQELRMTVAEAELTISATDTETLTELLPRVRLLDIYPNADFQNVSDTDIPAYVVFGEMREVPLVLCQSATNQYDYGAFRIPATGSLVLNAVYRNGRVVQAGEYSLVESPSGYYVIRFTRQQMDPNGTPFRIQATVTATEFVNPANAIKFLLSDSTFGLGKLVNAASFSTAATAYSTLSMAIVGGLTRRESAGDLLSLLLLYGAALDKNTAGEYTILVDSAASHTSASIVLGADDRQWNNVMLPSISVPLTPLASRVKQLNISGLFKPGFQGSGAYLLKATRSDTTRKGTVKEIQNPFLGDTTSIDKQCDYLWKRLCCRDKQVECSAEMSVSQSLTLGQLVRFNSPDLAIDEVYEVRALGFRGNKDRDGNIDAAVTVGLSGYLASIFTYTAGTVQAAPTASYATDYSLTPPSAPTGFALNGSATILTTNDGKKKTLQPVKATAPSVNVSQLWFRAVPAGAVESSYVVVPVTLGQIDAPCTLEMQPGISYTLECYAYNGANDPSARLSLVSQITSHTAAGDTTAPSDVTIGSAVAGTGKSIVVTWTRVTAADLKEYIIYRGTSTNPTTEYARSLTNAFTDTNVAYGTTYHYRVKAVDNSGNLSANYSSNVSAAVAKITGSDDVASGTITGGNIASGTITGSLIASATITGGLISNVTITGANIVDSTITSSKRQLISEQTTSGSTPAAGNYFFTQFITHSLGRKPLATITDFSGIDLLPSIIDVTTTTTSVKIFDRDPSSSRSWSITIGYW